MLQQRHQQQLFFDSESRLQHQMKHTKKNKKVGNCEYY